MVKIVNYFSIFYKKNFKNKLLIYVLRTHINKFLIKKHKIVKILTVIVLKRRLFIP